MGCGSKGIFFCWVGQFGSCIELAYLLGNVSRCLGTISFKLL